MGMDWKSSSWIICAIYGQHTDWRYVWFTYQTTLSPWSSCLRIGLTSTPQINTLQHQKDNLRTSK